MNFSENIEKLWLSGKGFYWTISGGAVAKVWQKYNGLAIPNTFVEKFIGKSKRYELQPDGYLFRLYDDNGDWSEKVIIGYNSEETFLKVNQHIEKYVFGNIDERKKAFSDDKEYSEDLANKLAAFIDLIDFEGITEMSDRCIDYLKILVEEAGLLIYRYSDNRRLINNFNSCKESLNYIRPFEINKIEFINANDENF